MSNRVWKRSTVSTQTTTRKYIVDIAGSLPTILMEIDPCETDPNRSITTKYYYANAQILKREQLTYGAAEVPGYWDTIETEYCDDYCLQSCLNYAEGWCFGEPNCCHQSCCYTDVQQQWVHPIPMEVNTVSHYYIHDRLGSIRLLVNDVGDVNNSYMYSPFGADLAAETIETADNPFKFTGQWYDSEIGQYYLRARMYDPALMRFTGRDPVRGKYQNPLTFNPYLYCVCDPINGVDPTGEEYESLASMLMTTAIQAALGGLSGGITGGWQGAASGALGGATTAWLGGAGFMAKIITSSVGSLVEHGSNKLFHGQRDFESIVATSFADGIIDQVTFGQGNKLSQKFLTKQFDKQFFKMFAQSSGEATAKAAYSQFIEWLYESQMGEDE